MKAPREKEIWDANDLPIGEIENSERKIRQIVVKAKKSEKDDSRRSKQEYPGQEDITDEEISQFRAWVAEKVKRGNVTLLLYTIFVLLYTALNCYIYSFEGDILIFGTSLFLLLGYIGVFGTVYVSKEDRELDDNEIKTVIKRLKEKNAWEAIHLNKPLPKEKLSLGEKIVVAVLLLFFIGIPLLSFVNHGLDLYYEKQRNNMWSSAVYTVQLTEETPTDKTIYYSA